MKAGEEEREQEYWFRCSMWALRRESWKRSRERSLGTAEVVGEEEGEGRASIARG